MGAEIGNPFIVGPPVPPSRFIGREYEVNTILSRLANPFNQGGSAIHGERRIGKTSLLHYVSAPLSHGSRETLSTDRCRFVFLDSHTLVQEISEPKGLEKSFWAQVFDDLTAWSRGWDDPSKQVAELKQTMLEGTLTHFQLMAFFQKLGGNGCLVVVLLDEFDVLMEQVDPKDPGFFYRLRGLLNWPAPRGFSLVVASREPLYVLFQDVKWRGSEFYNNLAMLPLGPFTDGEIGELLESYLKDTRFEPGKKKAIMDKKEAIIKDSQRHPQRVQELAFGLFNSIQENAEPEVSEGPRMGKLSLSHHDSRRLVEELMRMPDWEGGGKVGEKAVLRGAGMPKDYVNSLSLLGKPKIDARNVIDNLEDLGHLECRPAYHALGALVEYLLENTPSVEGKTFLAYLLAHYQLISTSDYQRELRERYAPPEMPALDKLVDLDWQVEQPSFSWQGPADPDQLEAIWSTRAPFVDAVFLEKGAKVARAICRIERADGFPLGTGFLIGPDLALTNHHVVPTDEKAKTAQIRFGYRVDQAGQLRHGEVYQVQGVLRRSPIEALDYVVLQVKNAPGGNPEIGYLKPVAGALKEGDALYIIQHPRGSPQKIVLQDNWITYVANDQRRVQYLTNTEHGSSGSPAFNERWDAVALHHSGSPLPVSPQTNYIRGNEGIPMMAILPEIEDLLPG